MSSDTRKARAICGVESPATIRRVSATWASGASAGWQQPTMSASWSSSTWSPSRSMRDSLRAVGIGRREVGGQRREPILEPLRSADLVDGLASAGRDQPGARSIGHPVDGPPRRGLDERVLRRILGDAEVADVAHERGHQPWPLRAEDVGDTHLVVGGQIHPVTVEAALCQPSNSMTGRTSTVPKCEFGILAAQSSASSRLATSIT